MLDCKVGRSTARLDRRAHYFQRLPWLDQLFGVKALYRSADLEWPIVACELGPLDDSALTGGEGFPKVLQANAQW
jgi:hypothetical protein